MTNLTNLLRVLLLGAAAGALGYALPSLAEVLRLEDLRVLWTATALGVLLLVALAGLAEARRMR